VDAANIAARIIATPIGLVQRCRLRIFTVVPLREGTPERTRAVVPGKFAASSL
jgi:hypothetical protein